MIAILLLLGSVLFLYYLVKKPYTYWAKKNVKTGEVIPIFGDNFRICLGKESPAEMVKRMYNKLPNVRYIGAYQFHVPVLILKCPKLIKELCVKNAEHFLDHGNLILASGDELWSRSLASLKGQRWKDMRAIVSPTFTSSKMKLMFTSITQHAKTFTQYFLETNDDLVEAEFRDAFTRYSNDIIASNAFGVQVDSLKDRKNLFYLMAFDACDFTVPWKKFVLFLYQLFPKIAIFFQASVFGSQVKTYFMSLVRDTIKIRQAQNIKRPDMIGLLMEAREEARNQISVGEEDSSSLAEDQSNICNLKEQLSDIDIAAQAFVIFVGAFETGSITMSFMAYELAINPDIQKKLIEEIDANNPPNGCPSYDTIMNMPYMDMVVSETLRKWPGAVGVTRVVTKPYTIQPEMPHESPLYLEEGVNLTIPIFGIHRDPKYFETPEKFDPERFSPENRKSADPNVYLPFGLGPRYCIGSRFGLLAVKSVFFHLLRDFEIIPTEETQVPLVISRHSMNLTSENGFPLALRRRRTSSALL